ncbi:MAG: DeoR family transcriptional regulator [Candidatus Promineifilaceae bacterium]
MTSIPVDRRDKILEWLKAVPVLTIEDLAERLNISNMTVHRDLQLLSEKGLVEKVHGGARLSISSPQTEVNVSKACAFCHMPIKRRLYFVINSREKDPITACCPHCGLLLLNYQDQAVTALLRDFIYGHIINARQAYFVVGSQISLCCEPSVLAFATVTDATNFCQGFGGQVMDFTQANQYLSKTH